MDTDAATYSTALTVSDKKVIDNIVTQCADRVVNIVYAKDDAASAEHEAIVKYRSHELAGCGAFVDFFGDLHSDDPNSVEPITWQVCGTPELMIKAKPYLQHYLRTPVYNYKGDDHKPNTACELPKWDEQFALTLTVLDILQMSDLAGFVRHEGLCQFLSLLTARAFKKMIEFRIVQIATQGRMVARTDKPVLTEKQVLERQVPFEGYPISRADMLRYKEALGDWLDVDIHSLEYSDSPCAR